MLLSVSHVTRYLYEDAARYTVQSLRMTPPSFAGQTVHSWQITAPGIETATTFRDAFGNIVHLTSITGEHSEIVCKCEGVVEVEDRAGIVRGLPEAAPVRVFLRETGKTQPDDAIRALAAETRGSHTLEGLHKLMHAVRDRMDYEIGVTGPHTTAAEALAAGRGVCQDHAHVFISAARVLGIPARYVSGYFLVDAKDPSEAHHAWAEAWIDGLGWVGFDPTNRLCPTDRYVRLVTGLDATFAAPVRGTRRGGLNEALDVLVEVQQANSQQ